MLALLVSLLTGFVGDVPAAQGDAASQTERVADQRMAWVAGPAPGGRVPSETVEPLGEPERSRFLAALARVAGRAEADTEVAVRRALDDLARLEDREEVWIRNTRAAALVRAGRAASALQVLDEALADFPDNGVLHANKAWALQELGRTAQAIAHFRRFLEDPIAERDPGLRRLAILDWARAELQLGRPDQATRLLSRWQAAYSGDARVHQFLAEAAYLRGEDPVYRRQAEQALEALAERHPPEQLETGGAYHAPVAGPFRARLTGEPRHEGPRYRYAIAIYPVRADTGWRPMTSTDEASAGGRVPVSSYVGFGQPVLAARDGVVVEASDDAHDLEYLGARPAGRGLRILPMNRVVLEHRYQGADGGTIVEHSVYERLMHSSLRVRLGDTVAAGDPLAAIGCTGPRVTDPHLGFHVTKPAGDGYPIGLRVRFQGLEQLDNPAPPQWSDRGPALLASGDIYRRAK